MPGGQYFYTNPNTAAIASNLARAFFGDPAAAAAQQQAQADLALTQAKVKSETNTGLLSGEKLSGMQQISHIFGNMRNPEEIKDVVGQLLSQNARAGGNPEDIAKGLRTYGALTGGSDELLGHLFAANGQTLGPNDGVSIADREGNRAKEFGNEMTKTRYSEGQANYRNSASNAAAIAQTNARIKAETDRFYAPAQVSTSIGETNRILRPDGTVAQVFTSDPAAVAADAATKARVAGGGQNGSPKYRPVSVAELNALDDSLAKALPPGVVSKNMSPQQTQFLNEIKTRAGDYLRNGYGADQAVKQAIDDLVVMDPEEKAPALVNTGGGWPWSSVVEEIQRNPKAPGAIAPAPLPGGMGNVFAGPGRAAAPAVAPSPVAPPALRSTQQPIQVPAQYANAPIGSQLTAPDGMELIMTPNGWMPKNGGQ
jgi:hypothetical protein